MLIRLIFSQNLCRVVVYGNQHIFCVCVYLYAVCISFTIQQSIYIVCFQICVDCVCVCVTRGGERVFKNFSVRSSTRIVFLTELSEQLLLFVLYANDNIHIILFTWIIPYSTIFCQNIWYTLTEFIPCDSSTWINWIFFEICRIYFVGFTHNFSLIRIPLHHQVWFIKKS